MVIRWAVGLVVVVTLVVGDMLLHYWPVVLVPGLWWGTLMLMAVYPLILIRVARRDLTVHGESAPLATTCMRMFRCMERYRWLLAAVMAVVITAGVEVWWLHVASWVWFVGFAWTISGASRTAHHRPMMFR